MLYFRNELYVNSVWPFSLYQCYVSFDDEIRLAFPGVESMVIFLESITEGKLYGIERFPNVFQGLEGVNCGDEVRFDLKRIRKASFQLPDWEC